MNFSLQRLRSSWDDVLDRIKRDLGLENKHSRYAENVRPLTHRAKEYVQMSEMDPAHAIAVEILYYGYIREAYLGESSPADSLEGWREHYSSSATGLDTSAAIASSRLLPPSISTVNHRFGVDKEFGDECLGLLETMLEERPDLRANQQ